MPLATSDTCAKTPRFRQMFDGLRDQISAGDLEAHTALPSERTLAERHGVSRMTARRALEAVEAEGLAYSDGRRGRFVSPKRVTYDISQMVSFAAEAQSRDIDLQIDLIAAGPAKADVTLAQALAVPMGEAMHTYTRLFKTSGHAIFIETESVVANHCPELLRYDLRQSTTKLLDQHYGIQSATGDIKIRMRAVRADEAELLGLSANHMGIELEQVIRDANGKPFCFGQQIWRGELAEFTARAMVGMPR